MSNVRADQCYDRFARRIGPRSRRNFSSESCGKIVDDLGGFRLHCAWYRPRMFRFKVNRQWTQRLSGADARSAGESQLLRVVVEQIKQSEWDVFRMTIKSSGCHSASFFGGLGFDGARAEITGPNDAALADDFLADLMNGREHTADAARNGFVRHRAVRDGEMSFFSEPVTIDLQVNVFHPRGRSAVKRRFDQRAQDVPDLRPALSGWSSKKLRVLRSEDRSIGVVIELAEFRSPPEQQWKTIDEQEARHHFQGGRPGFKRTERRLFPVERAHACAHLTASNQPIGA